jgi:hypothetical protein
MVRPSRLIQALVALPSTELRATWLSEQLGRWPIADAARLVNALAESSERGESGAREALMALVVLLVRPAAAPLVDQLRAAATEQRLLSLDRLVRRAPVPRMLLPDSESAAVPDYGTGRELTVGERRSLARRPDRAALDKLLHDPHRLVIRQLLENPMLTEDDVVRLAARRPPRPEVTDELAKSPRWLKCSRVRIALLHNPGSPTGLTLPLLGLCTRSELSEVVQSSEANVVLRATARELFALRPPLRRAAGMDERLQ